MHGWTVASITQEGPECPYYPLLSRICESDRVFEGGSMMRSSGNRCGGEVRPLQRDYVVWFWGSHCMTGGQRRQVDDAVISSSRFAIGNDSAYAEGRSFISLQYVSYQYYCITGVGGGGDLSHGASLSLGRQRPIFGSNCRSFFPRPRVPKMPHRSTEWLSPSQLCVTGHHAP